MKHYSLDADLVADNKDTAELVYPYWKSVLPLREINFYTFVFWPVKVRIIKKDINATH